MKKNIGKRIGCAALATQMLLTPVAEAAAPLHSWKPADSGQSRIVVSQSAQRLERFLLTKEQNLQSRKNFSHLDVATLFNRNEKAKQEQLVLTESAEDMTTPAVSLMEEIVDVSTQESSEMTDLDAEVEPLPTQAPLPEETAPADETTTPDEQEPTEEKEPDPEWSPDAGMDDIAPPPEETDEPSPEPSDTMDTPPADQEETTDGAEDVVQPPEASTFGVGAGGGPNFGGIDDVPPVDDLIAFFGFGSQYGPAELDKETWGTDWEYNFEGDWYNKRYSDMDMLFQTDQGLYVQGFEATMPGNWEWANDTIFIWNDSEGKAYFDGALMTAEDFPRLPNKEFSGKWYIYDSVNPGADDLVKEFIDETDTPYNSYQELVDDIWLNCKFDPERDTVEFDSTQPMDDYLIYADGLAYMLPIIAKWDPSSNATITKLSWSMVSTGEDNGQEVSFYPITGSNTVEKFSRMTAAELRKEIPVDTTQELAAEQVKYYARVPERIEALTFQLQAFEPDSTLEIKVEYGGEEKVVYNSDQLTHEITAKYPDNTESDPARGKWSFDGTDLTLPLECTSEEAKYNEVKLIVTAPSGDKKEYIFYIQRLAKARLQLNPGNTPYGMIDRTSNWDEEKKEAEKARFSASPLKGFQTGDRPGGEINNNGFIQSDGYHSNAWGKDQRNLDEDSGAIVVYQNTAFEEPGFYLYDGLGEKHEGATGIDVNWKLELILVDTLGPECAQDSVNGESKILEGTGNVDDISLTGYNVKPGVYKLQYTYTDLYDETVYSDESFSRSVVILPLRGDVDMDGAVTPADGVALERLLAEGYFSDVNLGNDQTKCLYYYRVCDVNGQTQSVDHGVYVTQTDVDSLLSGYDAVLEYSNNCNYFYIPLNNSEPKTKTVAVETQSPDKATFGLEYLGVGTDPSDLDTSARVDYDPDSPDVFWMEATLEQADQLPAELGGDLTSLTVTFTYDATYVQPYQPAGGGSWGDYIASQNSQWSGWKIQNAEIGIKPVDHDFKAVNALAQTVGSDLRELRFSVTAFTGAETGLAALEQSGILRVPFQMKAFPTGMVDSDCKLIELTLGMRDLAVTTNTGSAVWNNGQAGQTVTSVTQNLASITTYSGSMAVPLGEDNTPCYVIHVQMGTTNPVYGAQFQSNTYGVNGDDKENLPHDPSGGLTSGRLPKGVEYRAQYGYLDGKPEEAGTFDFTLKGSNVPFRLIVDPRVLELTVQDVIKFYGETGTTEQTFTYDPKQIDPLDLTDDKSNTGTEDDLNNLLDGYVRPTISLVKSVNDQTALQTSTVPGEYTVLIQGGKSKNYKFHFTQNHGQDAKHPEIGTAKLTILPRPILVDEITKSPLKNLWENTVQTKFNDVTVQYDKTSGSGKTEFTFAPLTNYIDKNGYYVDPKTNLPIAPLTTATDIVGSDKLELTLDFEVTPDRPGGYDLTDDEETRDAVIHTVSLTKGKGNNERYVLADEAPVSTSGEVAIQRRVMLKLEMQKKPTLDYLYGQSLLLGGMILNVYFEDIKNVAPPFDHEQCSTVQSCEEKGLKLYWVSAKGEVPTEDSPRVTAQEELNVKDHDGKYICITGTGNANRIWVGPYSITPRTLTLTLQGAKRYYGEDVAEWTVTYDHTQLAPWDQTSFPNTTGTITDLVKLPGYKAPKIETVLSGVPGSAAVTNMTDVGTYYALLTMSPSDNYKFNYICTTPTGGTSTRNDFGYAPLVIERRPILVTEIVSTPGSLFHDSDTNVISPATTVVGGGSEGFKAELPQTGIYYFNADGTSFQVEAGQSLSKNPICFGDTVSLTYEATFQPDNPGGNPFFEMGEKEHKKQPVAITKLELQENVKNDNKNYLLIYPNWPAAENGWAGATEGDSVTEGDIFRRRILGFEIVSEPKKTSYVYGETLSLDGLQLRIWYESSDGVAKVETVKYVAQMLGGVWQDTFTERGLTVSWSASDGPVASIWQQLSVAKHNGKRLVITGPQYPGETAKVQPIPTPITVLKKELTLTVTDIPKKYYGEDVSEYKFTFDVNQLSDWDKFALGSVAAEGVATELNSPAMSTALSLVNAPYEDGDPKNEFVGPKFATEVGKTTPVQDRAYPLELSGGSMANYEFKMVSGGITVAKRPIRVSSIIKNPIYSISETANRNYTYATTCYEGEVEGITYHELGLSPQGGIGLTGSALIEGDGIGISMSIMYYYYNSSLPFPDGAYEREENVRAYDFKLLAGGDSDNYELVKPVQSLSNPVSATGIVHKKDIVSISIYQQPSKSSYTYGDSLDLSGLLVRVTYDNGTSVTASPESLDGVYINYWDDPQRLPTESELPNIVGIRPASSGDHLTIAKDGSGFTHDGKYLLISARTHTSQPFVTPAVTRKPITVTPLELRYTLSADDKDYDGNRMGTGVITLTNVYPGDKVWVKNGTDYNNTPLPGNYAFSSGNYGQGITFTFMDENVSYRVAVPNEDTFLDERDITVEVTNIAIDGADKANYHINSEVKINTPQILGRDKAPTATIYPDHRDAPEVKIDLWVDEHTNTVEVRTEKSAGSFGDNNDKKNDQLHYEYALVYYDKDGNWVETDYQDSPYFGGELVKLAIPDFKPDGTPVERPEGTGGGQSINSNDKEFGSRDPLPRGTYVGALVRLSPTNNYKASLGTASVREYDDDGVIADQSELQAALQAAATAMDQTELPEPEKDTDRLQERVKGVAIKTYTYRIDLVSTSEEKNNSGEKVLAPILEEVWFTDIEEFATEKELGRLIENLQPVRYFSYSWDEEESVKVEFPLILNGPIKVEIPVKNEDGTTSKVETIMNTDDIIRLYVPVFRSGSNGYFEPESIRIEPNELELKIDDDPVKLKAVIIPTYATEQRVTWKSSDENVVTVSRDGIVTVVGIGTAWITARTVNGLSDTIEVRVGQSKIPYENTMFNAGYTGAYMGLIDGRFEPERTMTRQELTVLMEHFFQMIEGKEPTTPGEYIDVPKDAEYIEEIRTLDKWGIVNGIGENMYAPDRPATRAEISIILCRMLDLPVANDPNVSHAFIDAGPEDTWAWAYIDALAKAGITKGTGDQAYNPNRILTRAEVAVFVARILTTRVDINAKDLIVPTDVTEEHWAYREILRAVNSGAVLLVEESK